MLWEWQRIAAAVADPITMRASIGTIFAKKFGKTFAYLLAASQLLKLPKLISVALAPASGKCLGLCNDGCASTRLSPQPPLLPAWYYSRD